MGYPVHKFLEEFETEDAQLTNIVRALRSRSTATESERAASARAEEAYARGHDEGRAAAEADHRAELTAMRAGYEERMERSSALFCESLTEKLVSELRRQIDAVHATISDQLVSALLPVLRHVLTEASVRELAGGLGDLLNEAEALTVELRGPQELIDRVIGCLSQSQPPAEPRIRCVVDETAELRVTANDTVIEARLMDWIKRLTMAVA